MIHWGDNSRCVRLGFCWPLSCRGASSTEQSPQLLLSRCRRKSTPPKAIALSIVMLLFSLGSCTNDRSAAEKSVGISGVTQMATAQRVGCPELQVLSANIKRDGFGSMSNWKVRFKNTSKDPVGNLQYRTSYFAETGVRVGVGGKSTPGGTPIYSRIEAGTTRDLQINDGLLDSQAITGRFELTDCEILGPKPPIPKAAGPSQAVRNSAAKRLSDGRMIFLAEGTTLVVTMADDRMTPDQNAELTKAGFIDDKEARLALQSFGFTRLRLENGGRTFTWDTR